MLDCRANLYAWVIYLFISWPFIIMWIQVKLKGELEENKSMGVFHIEIKRWTTYIFIFLFSEIGYRLLYMLCLQYAYACFMCVYLYFFYKILSTKSNLMYNMLQPKKENASWYVFFHGVDCCPMCSFTFIHMLLLWLFVAVTTCGFFFCCHCHYLVLIPPLQGYIC